jgi:2-keto-3-deoxy-L-rhamnonate aldolase RhmA
MLWLSKNLVTLQFSHASFELKLLTDLLGYMTDEGAQALTRIQTEKAWFVKKRLEFTVPAEVA